MTELTTRGSKYTNEHRRQAVIGYCVLGHISQVSRETSIPQTTLTHWKNKSSWWDDMVAEVRNEINDHILAQNLTIATKSGEVIIDRLENGDYKLVQSKDNKGKYHHMTRVPMSGRDASIVGGISQDKARVQLGLATSITKSATGLDAMVKKFEAIADSYNERQAKVISDQ